MTYVHVEYLDRAYRVLAVFAVPAKHRHAFTFIDGYYSFDLSAILASGGFVVAKGRSVEI